MHQAMLNAAGALGHLQGWPAAAGKAGREVSDKGHLEFLPDDARSAVSRLITAGNRIP